jgi:hypothetical protein
LIVQIDAYNRAAEFTIADLMRDPAKPATVADHVRLTIARLSGEAEWTRALLERLRVGEHWLAGEPDPPPWRAAIPAPT